MRTAGKLLAGLAIAVTATGLTATGPATAQQIKLTFADQNSPTAWGPAHALYPWVKQVEEATKGRVKIDVYPSQTLVKGIDMWKAASAGTIDIGWCVQSYWADLTPLNDVIVLPGLSATTPSEKFSEVAWKLYEKYPGLRKEFEGAGVQPLAIYTAGTYLVISGKKQIKTLEDMKGMKVRAVGAPAIEHLKALGGVPTPMPMPDVYQALEKGVIDGASVPWEAIHGFRLYENAKYVTVVPMSRVYFSICANRNKLQSLPADVREQIMSVSGLKGSIFWGKNFFDSAEAGALEKAKEGGKEIVKYELTPTEQARWVELAKPIHEEWVKKMEAKGHTDARAILNDMLAMLKS